MESILYPVNEIKLSTIGKNLIPFTPKIIIINDNSFNFDHDILSLDEKLTCLILFHINNRESYDCVNVFYSVAESATGAKVGTCNILSNPLVNNFLGNLSNNPNNPMYWLVLKQIPFIVLFKAGWPVSFYNGVRSTGSILDYIHESLANSIRFEKTATAKSVISDVQIGIKNSELAPLNFEVKRKINYKDEIPEILRDEILEDEISKISEIPEDEISKISEIPEILEDEMFEKSGKNFITSKMMKSDGERKYIPGMYLISKKRPENKEDSYEIFMN